MLDPERWQPVPALWRSPPPARPPNRREDRRWVCPKTQEAGMDRTPEMPWDEGPPDQSPFMGSLVTAVLQDQPSAWLLLFNFLYTHPKQFLIPPLPVYLVN